MANNKYLYKSIGFKICMILFIYFISFGNLFAADTLELYSKAAILIDNDSGKILYGKNENEKVYPASTTKVLTAILALEKLDINSSVVVSKEAVNLPYGSSNAALKQGEVISVKDLLYALMLKSGNDCANVLAEAVSGSIDSFIDLMNSKLYELGCTNSHFANAHGYHDDNHYTTPKDMMKILSYAIKNEEFVKLISTSSYSIEATNKTDEKRFYQNTNRLILTKEDSYLSRYYEYCVGGKTGYTDEAGRTLVAYAKKDDKNLLIGVFNATTSGSQDVRYTDAINLFDYGFDNFEKAKLIDKTNYNFSYTNQETNLVYNYQLKEDIYALSKTDTTSPLIIDYTVNLDYDKLNKYTESSTDYKGQNVGIITINFKQDDNEYSKDFDLELVSIAQGKSNVSKNIKEITKNISICVIIIFVLFILLKLSTKLSKKQKKQKVGISRKDRRHKVKYVSRRTRR